MGVDDIAAIEALADSMGDEPKRLAIVERSTAGPTVRVRRPRRGVISPSPPGNRRLMPVGVYTYPGHGSSVSGVRELAARDQEVAPTTAVRSFAGVGVSAEVVSAGSTPTVAFSTNSLITEVRPGEYVFCDMDNTRGPASEPFSRWCPTTCARS